MLSLFEGGNRRTALLRAALMIGGIALIDWLIRANLPLGFLYLFPMLVVGNSLTRAEIAIVAAVCTFLTEAYDAFEWSAPSGIPRDILYFAAFFCMGLFVFEANRSRKQALRHVAQIEHEGQARREAEEQLKVLVESSPAAILTADAEGVVLLANDAAHRLLGLAPGELPGQFIGTYLPALVCVPGPGEHRQLFRTVMQCRGRRQDGEAFLADVWFSTYRTTAGFRLAAMVVDTSEDLRTREEASLHHLLAGSRILVGAVSHEIRNVCGAIAVVHDNLARNAGLAQSKDFEALGTLIGALERIAAMELRQSANQVSALDLQSLIEELRIVVDLALRDQGISVDWSIEPGLPCVWADRQSLMQVFLNLIKNAEQAMANSPKRQLIIAAKHQRNIVTVRVTDTGGGVAHPDKLFKPFQQNAKRTGLGLYLARGFMRSFRGELRYEGNAAGAIFVVELAAVLPEHLEEGYGRADPDIADRRSQSVSG